MHLRPVSMIRTRDDRVVPATGRYEIDDGRTSVQFVAQHLMVTKVRGRFRKVRDQIHIAENPEDSHVAASIAAASLDTGNDRRDTHLRSAEVNREDFRLTWNQRLETGGVLIGSAVRIELAVAALATMAPTVA